MGDTATRGRTDGVPTQSFPALSRRLTPATLVTRNDKSRSKNHMSKLNMNRLGFFALGTFLGGWVLGFIGGLVGKKG